MISDEEARLFFQAMKDLPGEYGGVGSLQIYHGIPTALWQDAHPGGCKRHFAVFNEFGIIPNYCFGCYKVQIAPRTVVELFKLLMVFERIALPVDNTRKCMAEGRDDCSGTYKGFVYCRGADEGEAVLDLVRRAVADGISPNVPVALKRGCSEFAQAHPAYSPTQPDVAPMTYDTAWQVYEDEVDRRLGISHGVPRGDAATAAPPSVPYTAAEIFAMRYWLQYAATIGDVSYFKLTGYKVPPIPQLRRPPFVAPAPDEVTS